MTKDCYRVWLGPNPNKNEIKNGKVLIIPLLLYRESLEMFTNSFDWLCQGYMRALLLVGWRHVLMFTQ